MDMAAGRVDFFRGVYRGIVSEVARELGISQPSVTARIKRRDPATLAIVLEKMRARDEQAKAEAAIVAEYERRARAAA